MITFKSQKIPRSVALFYVSYTVSPYISRVSIYHSCDRFGHIKAIYRSKPRCVHCGTKGHIFDKEQCPYSNELPKCCNCGENHRADSCSCPELLIQKEIRQYAVCISLLNASDIVRGNRSPSSNTSSLYIDEYPPLPHITANL